MGNVKYNVKHVIQFNSNIIIYIQRYKLSSFMFNHQNELSTFDDAEPDTGLDFFGDSVVLIGGPNKSLNWASSGGRIKICKYKIYSSHYECIFQII